MSKTTEPFARLLRDAFAAGPETSAPARLADALRQACAEGLLELPEHLVQARAEGYARRLVHLDPQHRFSVLAMTWAPGQGTPLHDHGGAWGVECVYQGEMEADSFLQTAAAPDGRLRFDQLGTERAGRGVSDVLEPPLDYHVMRNPSDSQPAVTLHIYPGELTECRIFHPLGDGWYQPETRQLSYTD